MQANVQKITELKKKDEAQTYITEYTTAWKNGIRWRTMDRFIIKRNFKNYILANTTANDIVESYYLDNSSIFKKILPSYQADNVTLTAVYSNKDRTEKKSHKYEKSLAITAYNTFQIVVLQV